MSSVVLISNALHYLFNLSCINFLGDCEVIAVHTAIGVASIRLASGEEGGGGSFDVERDQGHRHNSSI